MIGLQSRIFQGSRNIFIFKVRVILKYLLPGHSRRKQIQNVFDANPHTTDTWPTAALIGIYSNSIQGMGHFNLHWLVRIFLA